MNGALTPMKVLLFGLDTQLAQELHAALAEAGGCVPAVDRLGADVIFCAADPACYRPALDILRREQPGLPVIVVSRHPMASEWIDAIEAGVTDYCAAPFEPAQLQWLLETSRHARRSAAAA